MLKKYLEHIHSQPTHYRRQHAAKIATVVTAVVFMGWVATTGVRATTAASTPVVAGDTPTQETQLANVINGVDTPQTSNTLEVSTTTTYTGQ